MVIIFWLVTFILFTTTTFLLIKFVSRHPKSKEALKTIANGFKESLQGSGLNTSSQPRYPVELWKWESCEDEETCEECMDRSDWAPMDIADWMREGLPGTPEADTECGEECRCRLVRYNPKKHSSRHHRNH